MHLNAERLPERKQIGATSKEETTSGEVPGEFLWRTPVHPGALEPIVRAGPCGEDLFSLLATPPPFFFVQREASAGLSKSLSQIGTCCFFNVC